MYLCAFIQVKPAGNVHTLMSPSALRVDVEYSSTRGHRTKTGEKSSFVMNKMKVLFLFVVARFNAFLPWE